MEENNVLTNKQKKQQKLENLRREIDLQANKVREMRKNCEGAWRNNVKKIQNRKYKQNS